MIAELGNFCLIFVLILDMVSIFALSLKYYNAYTQFNQISILVANIKFIFISLAFLILIYCFYISDFSVLLVAEYSSTTKPTIYKIAGSWGNHEGSMLLWLWEYHFINFLFIIFTKIKKSNKAYILVVQSIISLLLGSFIYYSSNPFIHIEPLTEGRGLNPLLQDIGLAIHPPVLYLGYVTLSLGFSYSIVALIKGKFSYKEIKYLKTWISISWIFLTLGITLGSWWAYRELGWGGFWFWDPVENISLMPWLISTALIHITNLAIKKKIFANWFIFLNIFGFCLSLVGSFLVRSGIITSVHNFANDSARGVYLLAILAFVSTISFSIFAFRIHKINTQQKLMLFTKEGSILINNLFLIIASFTILIGTLYPIFYQFFGNQISVGEGYFVNTFIPILIIMLFIMGFTSEFKWGKIIKLPKIIFLELLVSTILSLLIVNNSSGFNIKYFIALEASLFVIINMLNLIIRKKLFPKQNTSSYIMLIAHVAFGIGALAVTMNAYNQLENNAYISKNDKLNVGAYEVTLKNIDYSKKDNYYIRKAEFILVKNNKELAYLYPEFRFYELEKTTTYESDIYHSIYGDIYIVIGEEKEGKLGVKLYFKPMMDYVWLASIIMSFSLGVGIIRKSFAT